MIDKRWLLVGSVWLCLAGGCQSGEVNESSAASPTTTFQQDLDTLRRQGDVLVLRDGPRQVLVSPLYQGRVMTSTAAGDTAAGFGYLDYRTITSDSINRQFGSYGGEDRFWIAPQGGPYTLFFNPGDPQDFEHWFTPRPLNAEPFALVSADSTTVRMRKQMKLTNYSRTRFDVTVDRTVRLLKRADVERALNAFLPAGVRWVAFESDNQLTNSGTARWSSDTGLLSIWILGMFKPTARTTAILPVNRAPEVNEYFRDQLDELPGRKLHVTKRAVYFRTDGDYIGKIGIAPDYAIGAPQQGWLGSYSPDTQTLTLVQYVSQPQPGDVYLNSSWDKEADPYAGDVINVYNDGNLTRTPRPVRTFYELETSAPTRALKPGESLRHRHRTFHFLGDRAVLNRISLAALGVTLEGIE